MVCVVREKGGVEGSGAVLSPACATRGAVGVGGVGGMVWAWVVWGVGLTHQGLQFFMRGEVSVVISGQHHRDDDSPVQCAMCNEQ